MVTFGPALFGCVRCPTLVECRTHIVPADGPARAPIIAIGEAPGETEDRLAKPFIGRSGKLLRDTLAEMGAGANLVRYVNSISCRPPNNRTPTKTEIANCAPWLLAEILEVQPKVLLILGRVAETSVQSILPQIREEIPQIHLVITRHPAYLLRKPKERDQWREDLKRAIQLAESSTFWFELKEEVIAEPWEQGEPDLDAPYLAIDTETDSGIEDWRQTLVSWQVSDGEKTQLYLNGPVPQSSQPIWFHNARYDCPLLGIDLHDLSKWEDSMLAAYVLRLPAGLKTLGPQLTGIPMTPLTDIMGVGKKQIPVSQVYATAQLSPRMTEYAIKDAVVTSRIAQKLDGMLRAEPSLQRYYAEIEKPVAAILHDMEMVGIKVDTAALQKLSDDLGHKLDRIKKELGEFGLENPGSTQQLSKLLISMGLVLEVNNPETGSWKVDEPSLGKYRIQAVAWKKWEAVEVIDLVLEYREVQKIKSTYADGLLKARDGEGRIHTHWNQVVTDTGRLSSSKPNLQNIPARGEMGKVFRSIFIPADGYTFVVGDYSALEFRLFADYTQDPTMLEAFAHNEDIHQKIADQIGLSRSVTKTIGYGVLYGAEEAKVAEVAGAKSVDEAQAILRLIREKVPALLGWKDRIRDELTEKGYVETMFGWRNYYPLFQSPLNSERAAALREGCNIPMQGGAGGLVKRAMIQSHDLCQEYGARLLLQVHDELVFEVPDGAEGEFARKMSAIGEECGRPEISVKLEFECRAGMSWAEAKGSH